VSCLNYLTKHRVKQQKPALTGTYAVVCFIEKRMDWYGKVLVGILNDGGGD
jgi:hypothetical protein